MSGRNRMRSYSFRGSVISFMSPDHTCEGNVTNSLWFRASETGYKLMFRLVIIIWKGMSM